MTDNILKSNSLWFKVEKIHTCSSPAPNSRYSSRMAQNNFFNTCIKYSPTISVMDRKRIRAICDSFQHVNGEIEYEIELNGIPDKIWVKRCDLIGTKILEDYEDRRRRSRGSKLYYTEEPLIIEVVNNKGKRTRNGNNNSASTSKCSSVSSTPSLKSDTNSKSRRNSRNKEVLPVLSPNENVFNGVERKRKRGSGRSTNSSRSSVNSCTTTPSAEDSGESCRNSCNREVLSDREVNGTEVKRRSKRVRCSSNGESASSVTSTVSNYSDESSGNSCGKVSQTIGPNNNILESDIKDTSRFFVGLPQGLANPCPQGAKGSEESLKDNNNNQGTSPTFLSKRVRFNNLESDAVETPDSRPDSPESLTHTCTSSSAEISPESRISICNDEISSYLVPDGSKIDGLIREKIANFRFKPLYKRLTMKRIVDNYKKTRYLLSRRKFKDGGVKRGMFKKTKVTGKPKKAVSTKVMRSTNDEENVSEGITKEVPELPKVPSDDVTRHNNNNNTEEENDDKKNLLLKLLKYVCKLISDNLLITKAKSPMHALRLKEILNEIIDKSPDTISLDIDNEQKREFIKLIEEILEDYGKHHNSLTPRAYEKNVECKGVNTDVCSSEIFDYREFEKFFEKNFRYSFEYKKFDANSDKLVDHRVATRFAYKGNTLGGLIGSLCRYINIWMVYMDHLRCCQSNDNEIMLFLRYSMSINRIFYFSLYQTVLLSIFAWDDLLISIIFNHIFYDNIMLCNQACYCVYILT
uniref:MRG domain-containing protein n=1 Tax=Strongyloides papillosus TaxID=174720 RepID=A0A0N5B8Z3_STREA